MVHSIGRFSNGFIAGCNFDTFVDDILNKGRENRTPDKKMICIDCNRRVNFRGKGVACESCKNWFHAKCQDITDTQYLTMQHMVLICSYCAEKVTK